MLVMTHDRVPDLQKDVQRLIGCCMLRMQQYEHLMKSILAFHKMEGPVETLAALHSAHVDFSIGPHATGKVQGSSLYRV